MRKKFFVILATMALLLSGCGNDYSTVFDEVNTVEGVTLTLKEGTLKPSKATFILTNDSNQDVEVDSVEFHLETLKKDEWQENVGTRVSEWRREETETLPAGESIEKEVSWKGLCGTIHKGTHRMILIVDEQPVACEFEKD